jgi:simple sugar transport system permease protein
MIKKISMEKFLSTLWNARKTQLVVTLVLFGMWLAFATANPFAFTNIITYGSWFLVAPLTIIPALSLTYIVILGQIDLSFPSVMALSAWILAKAWSGQGPTIEGVVLALCVGAFAGLLNGILVTKSGLSSIIATLGTSFFWLGVVDLGSNGFGISLSPFQNSVPFRVLMSNIMGVPTSIIWSIFVAIVLWVLLNRHVFGAHLYIIGNNITAARTLGIKTDRVIVYAYTLHGLVSGFAGILAALTTGTFYPGIGQAYLLLSIAAVFIGGTLVTGGVGTIYGSFLGGLILSLIEMGVLSSGFSGYWTEVIEGVIIVTALLVQWRLILRERRMKLQEPKMTANEAGV